MHPIVTCGTLNASNPDNLSFWEAKLVQNKESFNIYLFANPIFCAISSFIPLLGHLAAKGLCCNPQLHSAELTRARYLNFKLQSSLHLSSYSHLMLKARKVN